jgi:hypothetical protein
LKSPQQNAVDEHALVSQQQMQDPADYGYFAFTSEQSSIMDFEVLCAVSTPQEKCVKH